MKKIVLSLALFSSLAIGISLTGQGKDNQSCGTFAECFSEILPNSGRGGNSGGGGGSGGGGDIPLPPPYKWKPVLTDATLQFFCDPDRTLYNGKTLFDHVKYDSTKVVNNGGILCMNVFLNSGAITFYPWSQKLTNFVFVSTQRVIDFPSNTVTLFSSVAHSNLEDIGNLKYYLTNGRDRYLYLYSYQNGNLLKQTSNGFLRYYSTQGYIYCSNGIKGKALFPYYSTNEYNVLAYKCNGTWESIRINWLNTPRYVNLQPFIIKNSLIFIGDKILKGFSLITFEICIQNKTCDWKSGKDIIDIKSIETTLYAKYNEKPSFYAIFPDINDGGFYLTKSTEGQLAYGFNTYYAYFELDNNLKITNGYISRLKSSGYTLKKEQDGMCILESQDEFGNVHRLEISKELTGNNCPTALLFYSPLRILSGNRGTLLVYGTVKVNNQYKEVIGILYPDSARVDGYYATKIPIYPQSIFKALVLGDLVYKGLFRVKGVDYYFFYSNNRVFLIHVPQFNRSDADAERY